MPISHPLYCLCLPSLLDSDNLLSTEIQRSSLEMSAYGAISRPPRSSILPSTEWPHPRNPHAIVTLVHVDLSAIVDANRYPGLFDHLHAVFADEVDKGLTYPQENMRDPDAFRAYFFAADVVIAIVGDGSGATPNPPAEPVGAPVAPVAKEVAVDLETARAGRPWDACVVGFYYVSGHPPVCIRFGSIRVCQPVTGAPCRWKCKCRQGLGPSNPVKTMAVSLILSILGETQLSRAFLARKLLPPMSFQNRKKVKVKGIVGGRSTL